MGVRGGSDGGVTATAFAVGNRWDSCSIRVDPSLGWFVIQFAHRTHSNWRPSRNIAPVIKIKPINSVSCIARTPGDVNVHRAPRVWEHPRRV